jgi:hypothetical protein
MPLVVLVRVNPTADLPRTLANGDAKVKAEARPATPPAGARHWIGRMISAEKWGGEQKQQEEPRRRQGVPV